MAPWRVRLACLMLLVLPLGVLAQQETSTLEICAPSSMNILDCGNSGTGGGSAAVGGNNLLQSSDGSGGFKAGNTGTFGTSLTGPLHIGGTAVGSTLTLQSTSGSGTTDALIFKTGAQVEAMRITTNQNVGIGVTPTAAEHFKVTTTRAGASVNGVGIFGSNTHSGDMGGVTPYFDGMRSDMTYLGTNISNAFLSTGRALATYYYYGSDTVEAMGTNGSQYNTMLVRGSATQNNEHFVYGGVLSYEIGTGFAHNATPGTAWFADWNLHSAIDVQHRGLAIGMWFFNNYYNGSPTDGADAALWIMTKQGVSAPDATHQAAATYPIDVGIGIIGDSSGGTQLGYTKAIQIGGTGSVRSSQIPSSKIGTGIDISQTTKALYVHAVTSGPAIQVDSDGGNVLVDTGVQTPTVWGGTAVSSALELKSTTGVGSSDSIKMTVGNNGGTEALRIITSGLIGIGTAVPTSTVSFAGNALRTIASERNTIANTAGGAVLIRSAGATVGATDKASGALRLATGVQTGNAAPGVVQLETGPLSPTSGTTDGAAAIARFITAGTKVLVDGSATTVVSSGVPTHTGTALIIKYAIQVTDGTNDQMEVGEVFVSDVNAAGVHTTTITEVNSQQSLSSGTLATTWSMTGANPTVVSVLADTSLTPSAGYPRITYSVEHFGHSSVTLQ